MEDQFNTPEKIKMAISNFTTLQQHPGWKLFESIVLANIEVVKEAIINGTGNPEDDNRLRDKLKIFEETLNTPKMMIGKLEPTEANKLSDDPYDVSLA